MSATVADVMTTRVVAVKRSADYKQICSMLHQYRVSACPVVNDTGKVVGVVSETDLLYKVADPNPPTGLIRLRWKLSEESKVNAVSAAELMSSPAISIQPDAPVAVAARTMQEHRVRRLPVVSPSGDLLGIVSQTDLLSVFERPDLHIQDEVVRDVIVKEFGLDPAEFEVSVLSGIVTIAGPVALLETALSLLARVRHTEGVVAVRDRLIVGEATGQPLGLLSTSDADAAPSHPSGGQAYVNMTVATSPRLDVKGLRPLQIVVISDDARRARDEDAPALAQGLVEVVNVERDGPLMDALDGLGVAADSEQYVGAVHLEVDGESHRPAASLDEQEPADAARRDEGTALGFGQIVQGCVPCGRSLARWKIQADAFEGASCDAHGDRQPSDSRRRGVRGRIRLQVAQVLRRHARSLGDLCHGQICRMSLLGYASADVRTTNTRILRHSSSRDAGFAANPTDILPAR